jgi:monoamine oxidase
MPFKTGITRRKFIGITAAATGSILTGFATRGRASDAKVVDVAIVGAGLAGLTTARDLARSGLDSFVVLEARDRVGGRTLNQPIGRGHVVEAGGQWVGPTQTAVMDLARELEIGTFPTYDRGKTVYVVQGKRSEVEPTASIIGLPDLEREIDSLARTIPLPDPWTAPKAKEYDATTLAQWLDQKGLSPADRIGLDIRTRLTFGAPAEQISFLYFLYYVRSAGGYGTLESIRGGAQDSRIVGGSQLLSLKMAEQLGSHVSLSSPVTKISNWATGSGPVVFETDRGSFKARRVVVALMPSLIARISFDPPLPELRRDLQDHWPTGGTGMKVHLVYPSPFWRNAGLSGQSFTVPGPYFWSIDNSPPDGSVGAIMAFADGSALPASESERKRIFSEAFARCFGKEALNPTAYYQQDWALETWNRGCVSPLSPTVLTRYGLSLRPAAGSLIWAGTETADIWTGYMDGAVRSGHRAALQVLESLAKCAH